MFFEAIQPFVLDLTASEQVFNIHLLNYGRSGSWLMASMGMTREMECTSFITPFRDTPNLNNKRIIFFLVFMHEIFLYVMNTQSHNSDRVQS